MGTGATFKKADLHVHAPGTGQNYHLGERRDLSSPKGRKEFAMEFVRRARQAGLDIIAITNHNDTSWIDPIRQAAEELRREVGELAVFPGVEVGSEAGESIHILAIFDRDTEVVEIEGFLVDIGLRKGKRFINNNVYPSSESFTRIVGRIQERGGLAIAAHVFSDKNSLLGAKANRGLARVQQFKCESLLGLDLGQVGSLSDLEEDEQRIILNKHDDLKRERPLGYLSTSDARSLDKIGSFFTWIKCEEVTLESLRRALLDPEARLRLPNDPPPEPKFVISTLEVENTGTGFLRGLRLEFNERLNCLIGGRGTGKSAIIELLRYLWEQEPVPARRRDIETFLPVFFPESARATAEVIVRETRGDGGGIQETLYRLKREGRRRTEVYRLEGSREVLTDLRPGDLFRLDVFGQKEVLFTSEDIRSQLELLDQMCGRSVEELNEEEKEILRNVRRVRMDLIELARQLEDRKARLERLPALRERLKRLQDPAIEEWASKEKLYRQEKGLWERILQELERVASALKPDSRVRLDLRLLIPEEEERKALPSAEIWSGLWDALRGLERQMDDRFDQMLQAVEEIRERVRSAKSQWEERYRQFEAEYEGQLRALGVTGDVVDEIKGLERDIGNLESLEREAKRMQEEIIKKAQEDWAPAVEKLQKVRQKRFEVRQAKAEEITRRLIPRVRITIAPGGDREALISMLRNVFLGSRLRAGDYEALANAFSQNFLATMAAIEQADEGTPENMRIFTRWSAPAAPEALKPLLEAPDKKGRILAFISWEKRLELAEYGIPDEVRVEVNIGEEKQPIWRPLGRRIGEGVSVGQGCTAILSIILLESPYPLILDQPEDDLDNRFIYDEIVQILRRERGKRQMLIATHNPNIPVAGDAEQIFALMAEEEHEGKGDLRCRIQAQGFIDARKVADQVVSILDGGKEAFERRKEKYGF